LRRKGYKWKQAKAREGGGVLGYYAARSLFLTLYCHFITLSEQHNPAVGAKTRLASVYSCKGAG